MKKTILTTVTISLILSGCGYVGYDPAAGHVKQSPFTNEDYHPGTIINGYTLPPEPDHEENDKTVAGIDVNGNGIRDDVERYIIIKESSPKAQYPQTWTAVMLQYARGYQELLVEKRAQKYNDAESCIHHIGLLLEQKNGYYYVPAVHRDLEYALMTNTEKRESAWLEGCPGNPGSCGGNFKYRENPLKGIHLYCEADISAIGELF